jgi:hypothetical protein
VKPPTPKTTGQQVIRQPEGTLGITLKHSR